jgi:hypothetical protein
MQIHDTFMLSTMCFVLQPLYTSSRMSQILAEALQDVQWAEEQLEAAETALLTRNCTQHQQLLPTVRQPKLWWLPPVKPVKHANASAPLPPRLPPRLPLRLPPWSPASLFMHWPAAREQVAPLLQRFTPQHLANLTTRDHPHLHHHPPAPAGERASSAAAVRGRRAAAARGRA